MGRFLGKRSWAFICSLAVLACWPIVHPIADIGIIDDWSYAAMARVLAHTGRYAYNGWETPMIGVLAYAAAFLVKIFGSSYTTVRFTVVLAAAAAGFMGQRLLVRLGLNDGNAALITLGTLFSTTLLPMCYLFMTDVPGLLGIVVCLYACVRAIQAEDRSAQAWLLTAVAVALIAGTCRQTVWIAGITMVPSAMWLLRDKRKVLMSGLVMLSVEFAGIAICVRWLRHAAFFQPEPALPRTISVQDMHLLAYIFLHALPTILFLTMPVLVAYLAVVPFSNRKAMAAGCTMLGVIALGAGLEIHRHSFTPWMETYLNGSGVLGTLFLAGWLPQELSHRTQLLLLVVAVASAAAFLAVYVDASRKRLNQRAGLPGAISWQQARLLIIPFCSLYLMALLPRAIAKTGVQNRYLVPLSFFAMAAAARFFQERLKMRLGLLSVAVVVSTAMFGVVATHDGFARYRAELAASAELLREGVPEDAIDGGGEYDGEVQIAHYGFVNDPRTTVPANIPRPVPRPESLKACEPFASHAHLFPAVTPVYMLASNVDACGGLTEFVPVSYTTWLAPHDQKIYVVKAH